MDAMDIGIRVAGTLAAAFALIVTAIVVVSALSRGDLIGLRDGILIFAGLMTLLLVVWALIWTVGR